MRRDVRDSALFREAAAVYESLRRPGTGQISEGADIHVAAGGRHAVFAGTLVDKLEGVPPTRICQIDLASGDTRVLTFGPNTDRMPKYSPDGTCIAFLSDRARSGDFQLYLFDAARGAAHGTPPIEGWVEYFHWSPDGRRILLGVAGHGADVSGGQGAISSSQHPAKNARSWLPAVETGDESYRWRHAWIYEVDTRRARQLGPTELNVWEAVWCGNDHIAVVASPGPAEGLWYNAHLHLVDIHSGQSRQLYAPRDQLGWPAAAPTGRHLAVVEATCSDRWVVSGDLRVIDAASGKLLCVDTLHIDVTHLEWCSERSLLLAGHRGFESVVAVYDVQSTTLREVWSSCEINGTGRYMYVAGLNDEGDCALIGEGFKRAPEVAVIRSGKYTPVRSFDLGYCEQVEGIADVERVAWFAPDGLQIQGWLLRPARQAPHPVVMYVHGGPVTHWGPMWLGRARSVPILLLLQRGYAVFLPNPRGSAGRGQEFARLVLGDMGGADTHDYLSGLDHLVQQGIADPRRLGVIGVSYGGFMACWLITRDRRFAAAVAVSPVTNQVTEHLVSNIPHFVKLFLADSYINPHGKYFSRSPIMHADKARTPTLNICGALDRCTPPEEAVQFHNALLEHGVESVLVTYPEEGHGVRKLPAAIDYAARVVGWFLEHMASSEAR